MIGNMHKKQYQQLPGPINWKEVGDPELTTITFHSPIAANPDL